MPIHMQTVSSSWSWSPAEISLVVLQTGSRYQPVMCLISLSQKTPLMNVGVSHFSLSKGQGMVVFQALKRAVESRQC